MGQELPPRPSDRHKNGVRFILKLAKVCGGTRPIREMAGTSKAFLGGIEAVYLAYQAAKDKNPGKLPVIVLEKTTPIKSGSGEKQSTNYQPTFKIVSWAPRGDLVFEPKASAAPQQPAQRTTPPATGSTKADPPKEMRRRRRFRQSGMEINGRARIKHPGPRVQLHHCIPGEGVGCRHPAKNPGWKNWQNAGLGVRRRACEYRS